MAKTDKTTPADKIAFIREHIGLSIAETQAKAKESGLKMTDAMISYYRQKVRLIARASGETLPGERPGGRKHAINSNTSADSRFTKLVIQELGISRAELLLANLRKQLDKVTG